MSGEQTVGVTVMRISVGQIMDPIDVQKWTTVLVRYVLADRHAGAVCLRDRSGLPDRSSLATFRRKSDGSDSLYSASHL
jgi:hypothetical protein